MQLAFWSRLTLRLAGLALVAHTLAADAPKIWKEGFDYLQLDPVNASNQHPVVFTAEQLERLLPRFQKKEKDKIRPYFNDDQVKDLSKVLVKAFAQSRAGDDVLFASAFRPFGLIISPRVMNSGRLFVENGQLNLIVGMCGAPFEDLYIATRGQTLKAFNHGSRIKATADLDCQLIGGSGAHTVNQRPDWLTLDIVATLSGRNDDNAPDGSAAPTFNSNGMAPAARPTFNAAPATTFQAEPAAGQAAPANNVQPTAQRPAASASPVMPVGVPSKIEERLTILKRLRDNGLINDAEFDQKRAAILKDL